jgi:AraC-like DNA-binding protein
MDLTIFRMLPVMNIDIHYDMGSGFFEIGYMMMGLPHLLLEGRNGGITHSPCLYITPPSGLRGRSIYSKNCPLKTISFHASCTAGEVMNKVIGERSSELWDAATERGINGRWKLYDITTPSPDVANCFLRVANCSFPSRVKQMFFENMFREILLRLISRELPGDETEAGIDEFEIERVRSIPKILMERFASPPSIPEFARDLSMSSARLKLGFKKIFGKPIYTYHRDICLELAANMLLDTNRPISEITLDAGYSSSGNFSKAFKKRYGVSPSVYRSKGCHSDR